MSFSRRAVLVGSVAWSLGASVGGADRALFATLDAVGALAGDRFHPGRALAAIGALSALAPEPRVAALRRYLASRSDPPDGLFAVLRALVELPAADQAPEPFPGVLLAGWLRPPALGSPIPAPPADLRQVPHWPLVMLHDVPLVAVAGYALGGHPEPLSVHLDGLAHARWRTAPLAPGSAGAVRYDLVHWGQWAADPATSALLEGQLVRYEGQK